MDQSLIEGNMWRYRGECRNCGNKHSWDLHERSEDVRDYGLFHKTIKGAYFPCFMKECPDCGNAAVFDLVAFSPFNRGE